MERTKGILQHVNAKTAKIFLHTVVQTNQYSFVNWIQQLMFKQINKHVYKLIDVATFIEN